MNAFAILTGIITVVAFLIQLWDRKPAWKPYLARISWIGVGILVGLASRFVIEINVSGPERVTLLEGLGLLLFGGAGILIALFFLTYVFSENDSRSQKAYRTATDLTSTLAIALIMFSFLFFGKSC